jgi:hypothetical protein
MVERDTNFFEVMVRQIVQNTWINVVLGKALRVLQQAKRVEPIRNLLHGGNHCLLIKSASRTKRSEVRYDRQHIILIEIAHHLRHE